MMDFLPIAVERQIIISLLSSAVIIGLVVVIRWALHRFWFSYLEATQTEKRRWLSNSRNTAVLVCLFGLTFVWGPEIRTFALSLVAIAAAIAIATKEFILCLVAAGYRAATRAVKVGDWISIGPNPRDLISGEIIDQTLLAIKLQEFRPGPASSVHAGRMVVVPNSMLLTGYLINESDVGPFSEQSITIPVAGRSNIGPQKQALLSAAEKVLHSHKQGIERFVRKLNDILESDLRNKLPRVLVTFKAPDEFELTLHYLAPLQLKTSIYQEISEEFLDIMANTEPSRQSAEPS